SMDREPGRNDGMTALHGAARQGWTQIAKFLIDNGAAQEIVAGSGRTPFDMAMGRFPPGYLAPPPEPKLETAMLLQEECMKSDSCTINDPVDFSNPDAIQ
ncbi:MAG: ankyrin repeat domain-containing protein, partial [Pseudohongiellaceae bacterium]